jgi:hypothetical protein
MASRLIFVTSVLSVLLFSSHFYYKQVMKMTKEKAVGRAHPIAWLVILVTALNRKQLLIDI